MATAFVPTWQPHVASTPWAEWLVTAWDKARFQGPRAAAAIVFTKFTAMLGQPGAYTAQPLCVAPYRDASTVAITGFGRTAETLRLKRGDVAVPLGEPDWTCAETRWVLQQTAREWVSGGTNDANMSDDNVLVMYYGALQSLAFATGCATTKATQTVWFEALVSLTRAFALLHKDVEAFRRVTKAMVATPGVDDMLQKALAHAMDPDAPWDEATILNILAVVVRRSLRHGTLAVGLAPGPLAVFVLVPLLRQVARDVDAGMVGEWSALDVMQAFNSRAAEVLDAVTKRCTADEGAFSAATLSALTACVGCALDEAVCGRLLEFCSRVADVSAPVPWSEWGALPPQPVLECIVVTRRFSLATGEGACFCAQVTSTAPAAFTAIGFKTTEWTGIQLRSLGLYTIRVEPTGAFEPQLCVTVGFSVLPESTAPVDLAREFIVSVSAERVTVEQDRVAVLRMARGTWPALVTFRNARVHVTFVRHGKGTGAPRARTASPPPRRKTRAAARAAVLSEEVEGYDSDTRDLLVLAKFAKQRGQRRV